MCYNERIMKKTFFARIIVSFFVSMPLFFSLGGCSQATEEIAADEESDEAFLKQSVEAKSAETDWAEALASGALTEKHDSVAGILKSVRITQDNVFAGRQDTFAPIYPYIDGFGSLDISNLGGDAKEVLDGFCDGFIAGENVFSYMSSPRQYELALFLYDLKEHISASKRGAKAHNFTSYIYAKPVISDELFLETVRFKADSGEYLDVDIYLENEGGVWRINQLDGKWQDEK